VHNEARPNLQISCRAIVRAAWLQLQPDAAWGLRSPRSWTSETPFACWELRRHRQHRADARRRVAYPDPARARARARDLRLRGPVQPRPHARSARRPAPQPSTKRAPTDALRDPEARPSPTNQALS